MAAISVSQEQVQGKGEQGRILVLLTVSGHEKKQQDHHKVCCVKIFGKPLAQKCADAGKGRFILPSFRAASAAIWPGLWRWIWFRRRRWCGSGGPFRNLSALIAAIRLRDITVIHSSYLPDRSCSPPELRNTEANRAIRAARMARSSF